MSFASSKCRRTCDRPDPWSGGRCQVSHSELRKHFANEPDCYSCRDLASTRLPRKLLLAETGKPLIQHTYEAAKKARRAGSVCVAADCEEIADGRTRIRRTGVFDQPQLCKRDGSAGGGCQTDFGCRYFCERARRRAGIVGGCDRFGGRIVGAASHGKHGDACYADPQSRKAARSSMRKSCAG